jgi:hypothetical protein
MNVARVLHIAELIYSFSCIYLCKELIQSVAVILVSVCARQTAAHPATMNGYTACTYK